MRTRAPTVLLLSVCLLAANPSEASAFCGFYVDSAGAELYNEATMVVLMREGTRTVLSMRNDYTGPPADFAMVVPVPVVLSKKNVKTLPREVFDRVERLSAPRLVEYWEEDPCHAIDVADGMIGFAGGGGSGSGYGRGAGGGLGVTVEARFAVGEYDVVILSAEDAGGLDTWLRTQGYKIPEGAEPLLRPYVTAGMKFFVAKVDIAKVKFEEGRARLSPLRFHYDTPDFTLPIRLGLMNSSGAQDLLVHILSREGRFEAANYDNVTIPTNLDVANATRESFGSFYAALFDATVAANPGAVVTEYAWQAGKCDPCPVTGLQPDEIATLGSDVVGAAATVPPVGSATTRDSAISKEIVRRIFRMHSAELRYCHGRFGMSTPGSATIAVAVDPDGNVSDVSVTDSSVAEKVGSCVAERVRKWTFPKPRDGKAVNITHPWRFAPGGSGGFVLTRLHFRYDADSLGEDLVFKTAPPIVGGREFLKGTKLEEGAVPADLNNFQARYAIRHAWTGPIECDEPVRGRWGGPSAPGTDDPGVQPALDTAFAPRGKVTLASYARAGGAAIGHEVLAAVPAAAGSAVGSGAGATGATGTGTGSAAAAGGSTGSSASETAGSSGCACVVGQSTRNSTGRALPLLLSGLVLLGIGCRARRRR